MVINIHEYGFVSSMKERTYKAHDRLQDIVWNAARKKSKRSLYGRVDLTDEDDFIIATVRDVLELHHQFTKKIRYSPLFVMNIT